MRGMGGNHEIRWQKSSFSGAEGPNCIEIAQLHGVLGLRESDDPATLLRPTGAQLAALLRVVKGNGDSPVG